MTVKDLISQDRASFQCSETEETNRTGLMITEESCSMVFFL